MIPSTILWNVLLFRPGFSIIRVSAFHLFTFLWPETTPLATPLGMTQWRVTTHPGPPPIDLFSYDTVWLLIHLIIVLVKFHIHKSRCSHSKPLSLIFWNENLSNIWILLWFPNTRKLSKLWFYALYLEFFVWNPLALLFCWSLFTLCMY